ncbi:TPA: HEAT repeat domain-containing protein [Candidatus Poribacteria bacterium]|nr:HEAT repeat domain-containing protein [Candidatus Poribacteria bacterium]HIO05848.1 HEAT repeat domain-containing protein [Candidatus Poribacteria bacterium]
MSLNCCMDCVNTCFEVVKGMMALHGMTIGEDAVPALIQELKDQNEHVREEVADVLWQIGTADVLKAVEEYQSRQ